MAYKFYNTWKNMVNRKQRSLNEQRSYLESCKKSLEEDRQEEAKGIMNSFTGSKYWEKNIKSTSKKIEKLEAELKTIMENIPENVQAEINEREEIFVTFADFISFLEKTWNSRDELLKKSCDEWLDKEIVELTNAWSKIKKLKLDEFREIARNNGYKNNYIMWDAKEKFINKAEMENYTKPRNELLEKAGFHELSEYVRISGRSLEELKHENLEDAQQSVLNLIDRVEDKVGKVTDWKGLHFGRNGMLNGRVTGNCGSVYVETIGAGGYNIQRFHYRVLLKK